MVAVGSPSKEPEPATPRARLPVHAGKAVAAIAATGVYFIASSSLFRVNLGPPRFDAKLTPSTTMSESEKAKKTVEGCSDGGPHDHIPPGEREIGSRQQFQAAESPLIAATVSRPGGHPVDRREPHALREDPFLRAEGAGDTG